MHYVCMVISCYCPCSYACYQVFVKNNAYNIHNKSTVVANYSLKCVSKHEMLHKSFMTTW